VETATHPDRWTRFRDQAQTGLLAKVACR
jgi:hypothetical protein